MEHFCMFCYKAQPRGVALGRYVVMPNHVHLFAALAIDGIALPSWVQSLRSVMGKELLRLGIQKPHWQEGFFDHLLRSQDSYAQKWNYVPNNPVRGGLVKNADDWPYQGEIVRFHLGDEVVAASLCRGVGIWNGTATEPRVLFPPLSSSLPLILCK